jgi:hypothetical protein
LPRDARNRYTELEKHVQTHMATAAGAPPRAMSLVDRDRPREPHVFIRGNQGRPGDRVPRQFLRLVAGDERKPFTDGSGRLELAKAIVDAKNPLTARVMVNRVWMHHFNQPLVTTPSDFGMRSDPPTHPELLDWLATRFIESGWSLKDLHRQIVLSATYRQCSANAECGMRNAELRSGDSNPQSAIRNPQSVDPENRLLWRMHRRRLEFESLRDSLLAVGGNLDGKMYGRPEELFTNAALRRRSVYGFIDRQDLPNVLRSFDFAGPDQSTERRPTTTVPQQALFLLNSPFSVQQAQAVIARPEVAAQTETKARIAALYRVLFQRSASDLETAAGEEFIAAAASAKHGDDKLDPWQQYAQLLLATNEFMFVD